MRASLLMALALLALGEGLPRLHPDLALIGAAFADDDDDGGDSDDDGGGGGRGARGDNDDDDGPRRRGVRRVARPPAPAPVVPLPEYRPEIVTLGLSAEDLAVLQAQGFVLLDSVALTSVAARAYRLAPPEGQSLTEARAAVRALPSGANADFNHFYRSNQAESCTGAHCAAFEQVQWTPPQGDTAQAGALSARVAGATPGGLGATEAGLAVGGLAAAILGPAEAATDTPATCGPAPRLGMIDTGINAGHEAFLHADLTLHHLEPVEGAPSAELHGTSVAALLIGDADGRTPGLAADLPLVAVDAFSRAGSDERADAFALLRALDLLAEAGVEVANLSLAGPENLAMTAALTHLIEDRGMVIVAAAGNHGPRAAPAWPAAHPGVIAVTAVDGQGRIYRRANQGDHIDLAAPGVQVWSAASIRGGRAKTGTSFAAPFVTAAAARLRQAQPGLSPAEIGAFLAQSAEDLGEPGKDPAFGHGLLRFPVSGC